MKKKQPRYWGRLSIHELEADIAYFGARLALAQAVPEGPHRSAQKKTYLALEQILRDDLDRLRGSRLKRRLRRESSGE